MRQLLSEIKTMTELRKVLMRRDDETKAARNERFIIARELYDAGVDPEDILMNEFGLEPDYLEDLLIEMEVI